MTNPWEPWDDLDIPPLVDANGMGSRFPRNIPPPPGAAVMPNGPPPTLAPTSTPQYWGTPFPQNYAFPPQPDPYAPWRQWNNSNTPAYPQPPGPSPYIPHQSMNPETPSRAFPRPQTPAQPSTQRKKSVSYHVQFPWSSQGDLSPLDLPAGMPEVQSFTPRALDMSTPSSSLSRTISSSSSSPAMYLDRPQQWRYDFKFKTGFASMFRSKSHTTRPLDGWSASLPGASRGFSSPFIVIDSAKLDLHPYLRYSKSRPMTIYDLRREPLTLMFRALDRPPLANDMDHSVTRPATQYMRIYHPRLPWYIEIKPNGAPYISLADFFQQLFVALNKPITKHDFYNNELDEADRDILTHAYLSRCRSEEERMEGVRRVDFLRGKFEWMGLMPGKNGMWRLKTG